MTVTINWETKVISVEKVDLDELQLIPTEIRELDLNLFHLTLRDLESSAEGIPYIPTHIHNTEVLLGGVTYARIIEIINDYTVTFEDGQYAVELTGANSNVADRVNVNQVSVRSHNAAGLITVDTGGTAPSVGEIRDGVWNADMGNYNIADSFGMGIRIILGLGHSNFKLVGHTWDANGNILTGTMYVYTDDTMTVVLKSYGITATFSGNNLTEYVSVEL